MNKKERIIIFEDLSKIEVIVENNGSWKPTKFDLKILDSVIINTIRGSKFSFIKNPKITNYNKLYKQYVPYYNKDNERIILVNTFCRIPGSPTKDNFDELFDWKNYYLIIDDGGACFWNIKINIDTKKAFDLNINGY
ncbi:hypothetical protein [Lacinutrix sp. 5H-3-7-4]|uniref:hypothetical protein n=1 Tax=Lacinutrix sp. (strain 5H-3-7-4) TaxID=983544 RepID=UPI00059D2FF3|nr:hypothetical protein [Lacinutrix sp. 5H-3-7-4]